MSDGTPIYDAASMESLRKRLRHDPLEIRRFRTALCKHFQDDQCVLDEFPWAAELTLHGLTLKKRFDSQLDGATKLVLRTEQGMLVEAVVLRIGTGRTTLCVSSQVGCAAACEFCATGKMGVAVNLSPSEIVDQILTSGQLLAREGRTIRNIVFMGMGEPFHNEDNVFAAIDILTDSQYFHHSPGRILVSSVGVADGMLRCVERFPRVGLALSLHSVRTAVREELIPLAKKHSLDDLKQVIREANRLQDGPIMIEYLMLANVTDTKQDLELLIDWLSGLRVHVNLIPFNSIEGSDLAGSESSVLAAFALGLKQAGLKTTTRYSLGSDIGAACGQLVKQENRRIAQRLSLARA